VRYDLPQPVTRHAASAGARAVAGSVPLRRGIAVVAVVGGALSAANAAPVLDRLPVPRDAGDDDVARIGLAAEDTPSSDDSDDSDDTVRASEVLDTDALASAVRRANAEGKRLAERQSADSEDSDSADSDSGSDSDDDSDDDGAVTGSSAVPEQATPGRTASRFPSEIIDPENWYLTLPTGKKGSPDTIDAAKLASYHSEFFQLNEQRNGVVFTANAGGVTTSGSHYPRSELREMNGDEKASWDGRKGTHTMVLDQAITETPKNKPDVIAGQIHGTTDDLMQIHLSGTQLTVKYADGKKKVPLDDNYQLGKRFNVKIESSEGHVKVWYDGAEKADLAINSSTSYFKAGAYVNSNTSKGDSSSAEGQVVIYNVDVQHA
jgi:Alginate lyase